MEPKPCILEGFYKDRDSDNLFNFTEPKPAREIEAGVFEFDVELTVVSNNGSEHKEIETWYAVPLEGEKPQPVIGPSFFCLYGRKPIAGIDYDPSAPLCQEDYEFFTGTGNYAD